MSKVDGMYSAIIRCYNLKLLLISGASLAHTVQLWCNSTVLREIFRNFFSFQQYYKLNSNADTLEGCSLLCVTFVCSTENIITYITKLFGMITTLHETYTYRYPLSGTNIQSRISFTTRFLKPQLTVVDHHLINPHCNYNYT